MLDRTCIALALVALSAVAGCGGGNGDAHSEPLASAFGDGARLSDVIGHPTWLDPDDEASGGCSYPADRSVRVTGITVVAIDRYDETSQGATGNYYVQDTLAQSAYVPEEGVPTPAFGMTIFNPSFSPPDLRLAPGDVTDVSGVIMEFAGPVVGRFPFCRTLPEIGGTMSFRFEGGEVQPTTLPLSALLGYDNARPYIGMLVRVENVQIAGAPSDSSGRYTARINMGAGVESSDIVRISNELYDLKSLGPVLEGSTFKAVSGVLTYFYGFRIAPRSPADFEL
ncbi:hypothetical protein [Chondromyces apiculatus]|uniref:Lipoprotein n=1 Tax=Chondromyces apiculatus DSM 436 TaxID=1192034 RepID=A0A017TG44_9BACT|nr:hypothetical protein [Chondromyces apiculatus]EYF07800.1 Hypothetical protein CAP_6822 [Chondromyces apiculatus DSM 436]